MTKPRRAKKPMVENGAGAGRLSADRASSGLKFKVLAEWPGSAKSWGGFWESVARSLNGPMRDVALAQARLGGTADDRCRWLLDTFVRRVPDTLSTRVRARVGANLTALTRVSWAGMPLW